MYTMILCSDNSSSLSYPLITAHFVISFLYYLYVILFKLDISRVKLWKLIPQIL